MLTNLFFFFSEAINCLIRAIEIYTDMVSLAMLFSLGGRVARPKGLTHLSAPSAQRGQGGRFMSSLLALHGAETRAQ